MDTVRIVSELYDCEFYYRHETDRDRCFNAPGNGSRNEGNPWWCQWLVKLVGFNGKELDNKPSEASGPLLALTKWPVTKPWEV